MYKITYHKLALSKDLKRLSYADATRIMRTINKKLSTDPIAFGKPLWRELKNCYRLRIDPYRVVYKVEKEKVTVFIIQIGLRKDMLVYMEAAKRLGLV